MSGWIRLLTLICSVSFFLGFIVGFDGDRAAARGAGVALAYALAHGIVATLVFGIPLWGLARGMVWVLAGFKRTQP